MTGHELLFDLHDDPTELVNIGGRSAAREKLEECRAELVGRLRSRPEGFVIDNQLRVLASSYPPIMQRNVPRQGQG